MSSMNLAGLLVLGLLLVMAQQSMQMNLRNPTSEIETSNCKIAEHYFGVLLSSNNNEQALLDSGLYEPDKENPYVDIAGRRFHLGTLNNTRIVYVNTGGFSVNVATAAQTLLLRFRTSGIILFGNAGSFDDEKLVPGDVAVPEAVAFTGVWDWNAFQSELERKGKGKLAFGEFNYPENGQNLLGNVEFGKVKLFRPNEAPKNVFWLPISTSWYTAATNALKDLELRRCYFDVCLTNKPKVVFGLRGSSSDIYVKNEAYGHFLRDSFNVSIADSDSAAGAMTSLSNDKLIVVFRGVSNVVGQANPNSQRLSYLASYNAFLAATKFINSIPTPRIACE